MAYQKSPSYLWQHASGCWFLKRPIPPSLQRHYINETTGKPRTHVVESLHTHSRAEAEKLKRTGLRLVEAEFARLSSGRMAIAPSRHDVRMMDLRQSIAQATALDGARTIGEDESRWDDPFGIGILQDMASETAQAMSKDVGLAASQTAHQLAVQPGRLSVKEALADRHKGASLREQTKAAEVKALTDLLEFMRAPDCLPEAITDEIAAAYVDTLNDGKLSHATKKGRLSCLGRLWGMKKVKAQLKKGATNPWREHDLKGRRKSTDEVTEETGRVWTPDEMVKILSAPAATDGRKRTYTRALFRELHVLGFITGMRLDEITSLRRLDVTQDEEGTVVNIRKAKTGAGVRAIPVIHAAAVAVIARRIQALTDPAGRLFGECVPGGPDNKTSWHVSKAMGRDRDRLGLSEVTFHSTRGTFMTLQENAGTNVVHVQRYVGHVIDSVMHKDYSAGSSVKTLRGVASAAQYPVQVEAEFERHFATCPQQEIAAAQHGALARVDAR